MGVEIACGLEPFDDLLGIDGQQRRPGLTRLLQIAADDRAAHLADLGDLLAGEEVDERFAFERLVGLAEPIGWKMHQ